MRLEPDEWLHLAKRLAIGQTGRHHHGRERRPNLVVGNTADRYWAYCNACKCGGVVMKEHVCITGVAAPAQSTDLLLPNDMVRVVDAEKAVQDAVLGFLAHKNMDARYLPELWFSKERCRLLIACGAGTGTTQWMGRDTTERSPQKWLTYNGSTYLHTPRSALRDVAVVVEDTFSMYKVAWAVGRNAHVYSSLGTSLSDALMLQLLRYNTVVVMYDGDRAGWIGNTLQTRRLRSCGIHAPHGYCAPPKHDPKDLSIADIQNLLESAVLPI